MHQNNSINHVRRSLSAGIASMPLWSLQPVSAQFAVTDAYIPRKKFAILIGNRDYKNNQELPPAKKNLKDLSDVLEYLEFNVESHFNLDLTHMHQVMRAFSVKLMAESKDSIPGSLIILFYFFGHGFQLKGKNYLVPAGLDPYKWDTLTRSMDLEESYGYLPKAYPGLTVAMIDACRTDPTADPNASFNQLRSPEGTITLFSTRSGRPALAPISEDRNTFFTQTLVSTLRGTNGNTPIDDLFQLVSERTRVAVEEEFKKFNLNFSPQFPESSINVRGKFILRNRALEEVYIERRAQRVGNAEETIALSTRWDRIQSTYEPRGVILLIREFKQRYQDSEYREALEAILIGAERSRAAQLKAGLTNATLIDYDNLDVVYSDTVTKTLRGDKDAAERLATFFSKGSNGVKKNLLRYRQWLIFAAELGNGIASWELAKEFNRLGLTGDAVRYEQLAKRLGYTPPPRLTNRGY